MSQPKQGRTVLFRADASAAIGLGHFMRCQTLADELLRNKKEVIFACRHLPREAAAFLRKGGYAVYPIPQEQEGWEADAQATRDALADTNADWLVVDHYHLDARWERAVRPWVRRIMVIDDLADRPHDCDLLLDQNLHPVMDGRYDDLVPQGCELLLGPSFALLRPDFQEARRTLQNRDGQVKRILISYGGSDLIDETDKALEAVARLNLPDIELDVVSGILNPHLKRVKKRCDDLPRTSLHRQVKNMARLMAAADLALGAAGTTAWERCFLGLPSLMTVVAPNQESIAQAVHAYGAGRNLGNWKSVTPEVIVSAVSELMEKPDVLREMSAQALKLMSAGDEKSGAALVVQAMKEREDGPE